MRRAVFFDRDDTLIVDVPYNGDPDRVELLPRAREACHLLNENGFLLFIISNQSGVGRGFITREQVEAVNQRVLHLLGEHLFTDIYCCYDDPNDPIDGCRKPSPAMIFQARDAYELELSSCFMIGDKRSDIQAGHAAGCRTVFLESRSDPRERQAAHEQADFVTTDLFRAAEWICKVST